MTADPIEMDTPWLARRDRLAQIVERQRSLQAHLHGGVDPADFEPEKRAEYIRGQVIALSDEIHEALAEVAWKPWSSDKSKFNRDAYVRELIDAFHFMLNLFIVAGVSPDELYVVFREKNDVNWSRHKKPGESYNASEGKCPCGRSLDDYSGKNVTVMGVIYHSLECPELGSVEVFRGEEPA